MEYKVRVLPGFQAELNAVLDALLPEHQDTALEMLDELDRVFDLVSAFPFSMQPYPLEKQHAEVYRAIDVKKYLAFYVVLDDVVEFRRFLHARSDLPSFFQSTD